MVLSFMSLSLIHWIGNWHASSNSRAKIWNTLPLALRSEHDINMFGFGLKRHFKSKPNWASNAFTILGCSNFFYLLLFFVLFFLFIRAPFKPASLNWAPLNKYCSKLKYLNKLKWHFYYDDDDNNDDVFY